MRCVLTRCRLLSWLPRSIVALSVVTTPCLDARAALPPGNAVQQWNQIAEDTVVSAGTFQNEGLIYMAYFPQPFTTP